jgi:biotin carboxyl carrier protein
MRHQLLPVLTFVFCLVVAWQLWRSQGPAGMATVGEVNERHVDVTAKKPGVLASARELRFHVGDVVQAAQVVARVKSPATQPAAGQPAAGASQAADEADEGAEDGADDNNSVPVSAPVDGQVLSIHRKGHQSIKAGQPILTIAASRGSTVTTYVKAGQKLPLDIGARVDVRPRSDPSKVYQGWVEKVGAEYDALPPRLLRDQKVKEWGLPVVVALPDGAAVHPGEVVDLTWRPAGGKVR